MSWRVLDETRAKIMDNGKPAFEIIVGWDRGMQSYFILAQDHTGQTTRQYGDPYFLNFGKDGSLPDLQAFSKMLHRLSQPMGPYPKGLIYWPVDPKLFHQLEADREQDQRLKRMREQEEEERKQQRTQREERQSGKPKWPWNWGMGRNHRLV